MSAVFRDLFTPADADRALQDSGTKTVVVYKHSPICDLSEHALEEMQEFLRISNPEQDVRIVDVLAARPASQRLESATGIRHESPQVLVLKNGAVTWSASHRRITASAVTAALSL
jgi:bacillithiol system protein YtxJ